MLKSHFVATLFWTEFGFLLKSAGFAVATALIGLFTFPLWTPWVTAGLLGACAFVAVFRAGYKARELDESARASGGLVPATAELSEKKTNDWLPLLVLFALAVMTLLIGPPVVSFAKARMTIQVDPLFQGAYEKFAPSLGHPVSERVYPNTDEYFQEKAVAIYFDTTDPHWAILSWPEWENHPDFPRNPKDVSVSDVRARFRKLADKLHFDLWGKKLDAPYSGLATIYSTNPKLYVEKFGWSQSYCIYRGAKHGVSVQRFEHGWLAGPFSNPLTKVRALNTFTGVILYDNKTWIAVDPSPAPTWTPSCTNAPFK